MRGGGGGGGASGGRGLRGRVGTTVLNGLPIKPPSQSHTAFSTDLLVYTGVVYGVQRAMKEHT